MTDPTAAALLSVDQGIASLRLNRPERMNAFNARMHADLRDALCAIENDGSVRAVILTGNGRGFCAGQDLNERAATFDRGGTPDLSQSLAENYNPLIQRLAAMPYPVIAAVNGVASGAGAALAIACDIVIAARSARFQFGFVRVALGPDSGTSWWLPRRVGPGRALTLMLTGNAIDAEHAFAIGLCDRVVGDEKVYTEAQLLASTFADGPKEALTSIKLLMRNAPAATLDAALEAEREIQCALGRHEHYQEAVTAFAAKRTPRFY